MKKLFLLLLLIPTLLQAQDFKHRYFHYNQYFDAPTPFMITANTIDGADDHAICLASGGTCTSSTRGALLFLTGNEAAGYLGEISLAAGGTAGSGINFLTGVGVNTNSQKWRMGPGATTSSDLVFGTSALASSVATIRGARGVDADDGILKLAGGDACDPLEGACITIRGNDVGSANNDGSINIIPGGGTYGWVNLYSTNGAGASLLRWLVNTAGDFSQNTTNGGNIVMAKANTGLIVGAAALHGDINAVAPTPSLFGFGITPFDFLRGDASASPAYATFFKSRATDGSADTVVQSNDGIVALRFYGADGASFRQAAEIDVEIDGTPGSSDMPGRFVFKTTPDGSAAPAEALRISNDKAVLAAGTIRTTATDIGWRVATGADTACTTTCGANKGCVFGQNTAALGYNIVSCSDNTADVCVCTTT